MWIHAFLFCEKCYFRRTNAYFFEKTMESNKHANRVEYEKLVTEGYVKGVYDDESNGFLVIHRDHGQNEWEENKRIGRLLAAHGDCIVLLPSKKELGSNDALRNGLDSEFKTIITTNISRALQGALRRGKIQATEIVCLIDVENPPHHEITYGIYNAVKFDDKVQIQRISILFRNGQLIELTRKEIQNNLFLKKFNF
jgi:hypothetical protein